MGWTIRMLELSETNDTLNYETVYVVDNVQCIDARRPYIGTIRLNAGMSDVYTLAGRIVFRNSKNDMSVMLYKTTQKILLTAMYVLMYGFCNFKIEGKEYVRSVKKGPVLIVANHKGLLDPPLIGLCFPYFSGIYPLRFITKDGFFKPFFSRLLFKSIGCFPAKKGQGTEEALKVPDDLLRAGAAVIFFPEGGIMNGGGLQAPKPGVGALALRFPDIPVLPVAIHGTNNTKGAAMILQRPRIRVKIGAPFTLRERKEGVFEPLSAQEAADLLFADVKRMYASIVELQE